ncbi:iron ABC transporter permease [Patulibacter sp. NPDC049589]|uniref:FecCD family ABC transporter permease n=1 Tax=Patulibacter sp. NPDC049589 TaxID=3154731 RepID=UPI00341C328D
MPLRQLGVLTVASVALVVAAVLSIALGSTTVSVHDVLHALPLVGDGQVDPATDQIVNSLRIPRTVTAILVGASLGVAGALLQGALSNPLASPDVIGVTAGSGFGAMILLLAAPSSIALVPLSALVFGLIATALVFMVAWAGRGGGSVARLILAGIAVSAVFTAGTTALMTAYPDRVSSAIFFVAGYLSYDGWGTLRDVWPYLAVGLAAAVLLIRPLDRLALGDDVAQSLGVRPRVVRLCAAGVAALLAAASAALAGLLGFLGLVVPHTVRLAGGTSSHRFVVPTSAVAGAALLLIADTVARRIAAPTDLPVGPFMVVLGVPLFLWLLRKAV